MRTEKVPGNRILAVLSVSLQCHWLLIEQTRYGVAWLARDKGNIKESEFTLGSYALLSSYANPS